MGIQQFSMPDEIARANIEHFKRLLQAETDPKKRSTLKRLLDEEDAKLATLKKQGKSKKS
jgi:hypothetical protein